MRDDDWLAGLAGAALLGGAGIVVVLIEWGISRFWRWVRAPRPALPADSASIERNASLKDERLRLP